MKKRVFYTELAYVLGILVLAVGTALMERADFGVSMVVAPAYILHLKVSQFLPFFSFGMAEYTFQASLLIAMMIVIRRARLSYLFSAVSAVAYGFVLDGAISLIAILPLDAFAVRLIIYTVGMLLCSFGVALLFHTYLPPAAYELFVKEVSARFGADIHKFKTVYDCVSCIVAVAMSFLFFGLWQFEGIYYGTVVCALLNGTLIALFSKLINRFWSFEDGLKLKKYFS